MTSYAVFQAIEQASNWVQPVTAPYALPYPESYWYHAYYTCDAIYSKLVLTPLARLYLWGPGMGGWGFWGGVDIHNICAQKTSLAAEFWAEHTEECVELVGKHFFSFVVVLQTVFYFILLFWIAKKIYKIVCQLCKHMLSQEKKRK